MGLRVKNVNYLDKLVNINYTFAEQEITSIIGCSGSGKTLLGNIILQLVIPESGTVEVDDSISNIFQNIEDNFTNIKVKDELKNIDYLRLQSSMKLVKLKEDVINKKISQLSKSDQLKLALVLVLCSNTKYIIFDEPTSCLDEKNKKIFKQILYFLKNELHKTIILISNDIDFVYEVTDKVILLNHGQIKLAVNKDELFDNYHILQKYQMEIPKIIEFIYICKRKKNKELSLTYEMNELIKDIYRHV